MNENNLLTLGLETSCDETAASVARGPFEILSSVVASQTDIHNKYGGVVPELASRRHAELISPLAMEALDKARVSIQDIGLVSVTRGPGLVGALLVGVSYAKAFAYARNIPLIGVNHLDGHVYAAFLENPQAPLPMVSLLVSGGHSELFVVREIGKLERLGGTRDDAAGEAFDKVAKMLGLAYPGGPEVERMARQGSAKFHVPVALPGDTMDFSFSGPKTAVKNIIRAQEKAGGVMPVADICASFQKSLIDALIAKTKVAVDVSGAKSISVGGGVACNGALRERMRTLGAALGLPVIIPSVSLCADNAAMIAAVGAYKYLADSANPAFMDYMELDADPAWEP
ncbi:MAG: tRNA (adenosine(37)-N6)-threonylcarbamoyltransferase complex transferase subunit TsaD [Nitrospinae bacterium]|nr:tRNA (adenosine(37)-N6)-threonylcarbamoyltransferase complex transferase subunit TsaD [Nitrospinota bacterium]